MNQITRTVSTVTIKASRVDVKDGKATLTPVEDVPVFNRSIADNAAAMKEVRKVYGNDGQFVVTEIKRDSCVYGVDFDVFMKHAKIVERPESQKPKADVSPTPAVVTTANAPARP